MSDADPIRRVGRGQFVHRDLLLATSHSWGKSTKLGTYLTLQIDYNMKSSL
jgi:hypothetical protein